VDNTRGELLPGSFALVRFDASTTPSALTVPGNALLFRAEGPRVGVVSADGKVALRPVKLGRDWGDQVEILSGLGQTDRVILNPSDSLADGSQVRIKPAVGGPTPR
jgi:multidrug efflux pump subunit AcrA (membrane-fusion protein)